MDEAVLSGRVERTLSKVEHHFAAGDVEAARLAARDVQQLAYQYGSEIMLHGIRTLIAWIESGKIGSPAARPVARLRAPSLD